MEKFEPPEKSKIENQIPVEPPATQRNFLACHPLLMGYSPKRCTPRRKPSMSDPRSGVPQNAEDAAAEKAARAASSAPSANDPNYRTAEQRAEDRRLKALSEALKAK